MQRWGASCVRAKSLQSCLTLHDLMTIACQSPLSMGLWLLNIPYKYPTSRLPTFKNMFIDWIHASYSGNVESQSLDCQGSPQLSFQKSLLFYNTGACFEVDGWVVRIGVAGAMGNWWYLYWWKSLLASKLLPFPILCFAIYALFVQITHSHILQLCGLSLFI